MIISIFGKKGSGKSTLSKEMMYRLGGKIVFISPVESLEEFDFELWGYDEIASYVEIMEPGQIAILRLMDIEAFDMIACIAMIEMDYTLVIDEIERYKNSENLSELIHYARHFGINLICNTRRYTDVPRLLTSQSDQIMIFATIEPRDLDYFKNYTDVSDLSVIKTLKAYNYYVFPDNTVRVTNPQFT